MKRGVPQDKEQLQNIIEGDLLCFLVFLKVKIEAPLSHRNTAPETPNQFSRRQFSDVTLRPHFTYMHNDKTIFTVEVKLTSDRCSGVCELTNHSRLFVEEGPFKETGAKTKRFSLRGNAELRHWTV